MKFRDMPGNKSLELIRVTEDSELPDKIVEVALAITRNEYRDVRIVPGTVATEGTPYRFDRPVHVVYGRLPKPKKNAKPSARLVGGIWLFFRDGLPYSGPYNHVL